MTDNAPDNATTGVGTDSPPAERVSAEDYKTRGQVRVKTDFMRAYNSADTSLPTITSEGLMVTREQADMLAEESGGLVYEDTDNTEKEK